MDRVDFVLNGKRLALTREQVLTAVGELRPQPAHAWALKAGEKIFPVKQIFGAATGASRREFTSHRARDLLRRLGFRVYDLRYDQSDSATTTCTSAESLGTRDTVALDATRHAALRAAVKLASSRPTMEIRALLETASQFEDWLLKRPSKSGLSSIDGPEV